MNEAERKEYDRAVVALEGTQKELRKLGSNVDTIKAYGEANRKLIRIVAISVVLDICLSLATIGAYVKESSDHNGVIEAAMASCQSSNTVRARDVHLWDHIFSLKPDTPRTPAQAEEIKQLRVYVANTFKQVDCNKIK